MKQNPKTDIKEGGSIDVSSRLYNKCIDCNNRKCTEGYPSYTEETLIYKIRVYNKNPCKSCIEQEKNQEDLKFRFREICRDEFKVI